MHQIPKIQNFNMAARTQMGAFGGQRARLGKPSPPGGLATLNSLERRPTAPICAHNREIETGGRGLKMA